MAAREPGWRRAARGVVGRPVNTPTFPRQARLPLHERVERSRLGQVLISLLVLITLASVIVVNLPRSALKRDLLRVDARYLNVTGLDQDWSLFAPDPRSRSIAILARVQYADGSTRAWTRPAGGALIGGYWDYHWQKWLEFVLDAHHRQLWRPAAVFIARQESQPGRRPVRVTLIRTTSLNEPPGQDRDHLPAISRAYYSLPITPAMLR